jgi:hypothetical protein
MPSIPAELVHHIDSTQWANCRLMHRSNIALVVCKQTFVDIVYLFRDTMRRVIGLVAHERIDILERTLTLSDV